jgi:hypothetical protein
VGRHIVGTPIEQRMLNVTPPLGRDLCANGCDPCRDAASERLQIACGRVAKISRLGSQCAGDAMRHRTNDDVSPASAMLRCARVNEVRTGVFSNDGPKGARAGRGLERDELA